MINFKRLDRWLGQAYDSDFKRVMTPQIAGEISLLIEMAREALELARVAAEEAHGPGTGARAFLKKWDKPNED